MANLIDSFVPVPPCTSLDENLEMSFELTFADYPVPARCDYGCHEFLTDDELCTDCQVYREQRRANHAAFAAEHAYDRGELEGQPLEAWGECCVCRYCGNGNVLCSCY